MDVMVGLTLCGHFYPEELDSARPGFWPVARAWADTGGYSSLSLGCVPHDGESHSAQQRMLAEHGNSSQPSVIRADIPLARAYAALVGLCGSSCKRCRQTLARAFLSLFLPEARYDLLRTDQPHGAGLLVTDAHAVGIVFAEFRWQEPGQ